jgi:putative tryptophan/tyrosine transport system substrate-binding protein
MWWSAVGCLVTLTLSMLVLPLLAVAQPVEQVRRIGMLRSGSAQEPDRSVEAFRQGLRDLGWVEGQNLIVEYRWAEGKDERLPDLAAELVRLQVEVLVAGGPPAIRAAQHATRTIPIVMTGTADPVGEGFVASRAQPGATSRA